MMNWDDVQFFFLMLVVPLGLVALLFFVVFAVTARTDPAVQDLTAQYAIENVLPGHKVFCVAPKGHGQPLFVIVRDGEAVSTMMPRMPKHGGNVSVLVEE